MIDWASSRKGFTRALLSYIVVLAFISVTASLLFIGPPDTSKELFFAGYGVLMAKAGDCISFYVGSSDGSKEKNDVIASELKDALD